jgi:hypothetical protein
MLNVQVRAAASPRALSAPDPRLALPRRSLTPPCASHVSPRHAEQELVVLRRVDPQQHEVRHLRHPPQGPQDVGRLLRQLHLHAGGHEARRRAVHLDVPPQGLPPLVHRRGHGTPPPPPRFPLRLPPLRLPQLALLTLPRPPPAGRDGVHRGRVQHERCVPAIDASSDPPAHPASASSEPPSARRSLLLPAPCRPQTSCPSTSSTRTPPPRRRASSRRRAARSTKRAPPAYLAQRLAARPVCSVRAPVGHLQRDSSAARALSPEEDRGP